MEVQGYGLCRVDIFYKLKHFYYIFYVYIYLLSFNRRQGQYLSYINDCVGERVISLLIVLVGKPSHFCINFSEGKHLLE